LLAVHEVPLNDWAEGKHPRLPESNDGESVIEDRLSVPPSALFTMPLIGYVAAVWASLNRPCPHVLFTLIAHVLKLPKMKLAVDRKTEELPVGAPQTTRRYSLSLSGVPEAWQRWGSPLETCLTYSDRYNVDCCEKTPSEVRVHLESS
jgi:hypothetical protein